MTKINDHEDYVRKVCIQPSNDSVRIVSGGLDATVRITVLHNNGDYVKDCTLNAKNSVYSLAAETKPTGLIAAGGPQHYIALFDTRDPPQVVAKLSGHKDIVKALQFMPDGNTLLAAGTDSCLRVWDLRIQKIVNTYRYPSSVWTISLPENAEDPDTYFCSTMDGSIYMTQHEPKVILKQESPILATLPILSKTSGDYSIWYSTPACDIHNARYVPGKSGPIPAKVVEPNSPSNIDLRLSSSPTSSRYTTITDVPTSCHDAPLQPNEALTIKGHPGFIRHAISNNKLHIIVEDQEKGVYLVNPLNVCNIHSCSTHISLNLHQ